MSTMENQLATLAASHRIPGAGRRDNAGLSDFEKLAIKCDRLRALNTKLLKACEGCANGLERDVRMYPGGHFPSAGRFANYAAALRTAIDAETETAEEVGS